MEVIPDHLVASLSRADRAARRRLRARADARKQRRKSPLAVEISNLLPPAALAALAALRAQQGTEPTAS
jgi:hypothetical protein